MQIELFLILEDVFRLGNAENPKLSNVRPRDVDTIVINEITFVRANGKGISVFDEVGINQSPMTGWIWRIKRGIQLPFGLKLINDKPHHYCIAPIQDMPLSKYKGLLEELASKAEKIRRTI